MSGNDDGHLFFGLIMMVMIMCVGVHLNEPAKEAPAPTVPQPTIEERMAASGFPCPTCLDVPEGIERVRTTMLFAGPTVEYPTAEYTTFLRGRCEGLGNPVGEAECNRVNRMLEEGRRYVESWVNPIYGGGPESKSEVARVRHAAYQTMRLVQEVERS